jgi:hypothetical protein
MSKNIYGGLVKKTNIIDTLCPVGQAWPTMLIYGSDWFFIWTLLFGIVCVQSSCLVTEQIQNDSSMAY